MNEATDFYDKEILEVGSNYTYLAVILTDFVLKKDDKYFLQMFLKKYKYIENDKKVVRYVNGDLDDLLMILMNNKLELQIKMGSFLKR